MFEISTAKMQGIDLSVLRLAFQRDGSIPRREGNSAHFFLFGAFPLARKARPRGEIS
jgi:hypothetical protein